MTTENAAKPAQPAQAACGPPENTPNKSKTKDKSHTYKNKDTA